MRSIQSIWHRERKGGEVETGRTEALSAVDANQERSSRPAQHNTPNTITVEALARKNTEFYTKSLKDSQIRLLVIHADEYDSDLTCDLEVVDLYHAPPFDAVSYCWSTVPNLHSITVDGFNGFTVQHSILQALRRLRLEFSKRYVWVDAICINQADDEEKSRQVAQMGHIYSTTNQCIVWLGESEPEWRNCRLRPDGYCTAPGLSSVTHGNMEQIFNEKLWKDEQASRTSAFWHRVWWKRLWILQEFALPACDPKIMIGPHTISWAFFAQLRWHNADEDNLLLKLRAMRDMMKLEGSSEEQSCRDLYELLLMTARKFSCSDPRDRIFSLLALVSDSSVPVSVDYSASIQKVYADAFMYMIQKRATLDVLVDGRDMRLEPYECSWIPDLKYLRPPNLSRTPDGYCASSRHPVVELLQPGPDLPVAFKFRGFRFDKIASRFYSDSLGLPIRTFCGERTSSGQTAIYSQYSFPLNLNKLRRYWALNRAPECLIQDVSTPAKILHTLSFEHRMQGYHRLDRMPQLGFLMLVYIFDGTRSIVPCMKEPLYQDRDEEAQIRTQAQKAAETFGLGTTRRVLHDLEVAGSWQDIFLLKWHSRRRTAKAATDNLVKKTYNSRPAPHTIDARGSSLLDDGAVVQLRTCVGKWHAIPMTGKYRTFFKTEDNFIGLGPESLAVGDDIVVPLGASRPWILRKQGEHYKLLGTAVIPCIMSGELMDFYDNGTLQAEDFVLV